MKVLVKKSDYNRVLLSETAPQDVPIIISNTWFYNHIRDLENDTNRETMKSKVVSFLFVSKDEDKDFIPLKYSILKSNGGLRHLGLLHPASQTQVIELYKNYNQRIIHQTSKSEFSIRKPFKASTHFYKAGSQKAFTELEPISTFFSYKSYTKLNKFFDAREFLSLERKYTKFWSLDISKCFESIYTHSISWAVKGKSFAKESRQSADFSSFFDRLMQRSNFNETNGIIIGNEVSRVFAEIILQAVDQELKDSLAKENLISGIDYDVKRYVDDYFIFSSSDSTLEQIVSTLESKLRFYKLHLNESKTVRHERPFITSITRAKLDTTEALSWLFQTIFKYNEDETLNPIRKPNKLKRSFLDRVMASSYDDSEAYTVMCGYIISAILNKIQRTLTSEKFLSNEYVVKKNILSLLVDIAFHLFNVSPTSSNSIKLCSICYFTFHFYKENHPEEIDFIVLEISALIKEFFSSSVILQRKSKVNSFVPIEFSNLLSISSSMGSEYLLSPAKISEIFGIERLRKTSEEYTTNEDCFDYFNIISALFYIKDEEEYNKIKETITKEINKRIGSLGNIDSDSRICYLFLDCMSCPHIDIKKRKQWAKKFEKICFGHQLPETESNELLEVLVSNKWFVCWDDQIILDSLLAKKDLLFGY